MRALIVSATALHGDHDPRTIRARRLIELLPAHGIVPGLLGLWTGRERSPPATAAAETLAIEIARPFDDSGAFDVWARRGSEAVTAMPPERRPDLIYAIGYPVEALEAGAAISAATGIPWIGDLGDPWEADDDGAAAVRTRTLGSAAAFVAASEALADELQPLLRPAAPVLVSPAGGVIRRRDGIHQPPLVVHLGSINPGRVDPRPAFSVLAEAHGRGEIEFRSHTNGWHEEVDFLAHPHLPMLPADDAIDLLANSAAALVLGNRNYVQVPSKIYEISCTQAWALCVTELDSDPAVRMLADSGHGVFAGNDRDWVRGALEQIIARERAGQRPHPAAEHSWQKRVAAIARLMARVALPNTETRG